MLVLIKKGTWTACVKVTVMCLVFSSAICDVIKQNESEVEKYDFCGFFFGGVFSIRVLL